MNPCVDFCYLKNNKQYSKECDDTCDYAKSLKERTVVLSRSYNEDPDDFSDYGTYILNDIMDIQRFASAVFFLGKSGAIDIKIDKPKVVDLSE